MTVTLVAAQSHLFLFFFTTFRILNLQMAFTRSPMHDLIPPTSQAYPHLTGVKSLTSQPRHGRRHMTPEVKDDISESDEQSPDERTYSSNNEQVCRPPFYTLCSFIL